MITHEPRAGRDKPATSLDFPGGGALFASAGAFLKPLSDGVSPWAQGAQPLPSLMVAGQPTRLLSADAREVKHDLDILVLAGDTAAFNHPRLSPVRRRRHVVGACRSVGFSVEATAAMSGRSMERGFQPHLISAPGHHNAPASSPPFRQRHSGVAVSAAAWKADTQSKQTRQYGPTMPKGDALPLFGICLRRSSDRPALNPKGAA